MNFKNLKTTFLYDAYKQYRYHQFMRAFHHRFPDSEIVPKNIFPLEILSVGKYSYGELNIVTFNESTKLKIGNFVSIAQNVFFLLDTEHYLDHLSTFPFKVKCLCEARCESFSKGAIVVEDDVWIGHGAAILSGVRVGQGAVIAAGAVVTKDVAPYSIVGGVPAKEIGKRFEQPVIDYLCTLDYGALTGQMVKDHIRELYASLEGIRLNDLKDRCSWFPKRNPV